MEKYKLERDGKKNLKIVGEKLAHVSNKRNDSQGWVEYTVYRTVRGGIVLHTAVHSLWEDSPSSYDAQTFRDFEGLSASLGFSELAKELYDDLGLDFSETID